MRPPTTKHEWTASDGTRVTIRSMQPEDREIERAFVQNLSPGSSHSRFFAAIKELSPKMLDQFTRVDFPREMALIATIERELVELQIGVARYAPGTSPGSVEFAVVVADDWQGCGVGRELMHYLIVSAQDAGLVRMEGVILVANSNMLGLCRELGFTVTRFPGDANLVQVQKNL